MIIMKIAERDNFLSQWKKYFKESELPISFYYTDEEGRAEKAKSTTGHRCIFGDLQKVRRGQPLYFDTDAVACFGGKRYLGLAQEITPNFEYFLSCGIPGKLEGERYKKSPELVKQAMQFQQPFKAPGRYIVFKRWDQLDERDEPQVVIFFARPDVLAGLFTLANFDQEEPNGVIAPFGSGCSTIVYIPYFQIESSRPKAVIGMFDISARPYVTKDELTFAAPLEKFQTMVNYMDESFLITESWKRVQKRIE
jgi:uncharacterized protein (DUF169 family)